MDELLTIQDELTRAFNSFESFKKYYNTYLAIKEPEIWGNELKQKLFKIQTYLEGVFVEKVKSETVLLWLNKIDTLNRGINLISRRVRNDLEEHEAYKDLPEAFFPEQFIEMEMEETGKTYEELEPVYLKIIQDGISFLHSIKPYSDIGLEIVGNSIREMKVEFKSIINEGNANKINVGESSSKPQDDISENETPVNKVKSISPPIGKDNVKTFELLNSQFLISTLHSNLVANPGLIDAIHLDEFKKLFSSRPESTTVNWKGNKNQLSYFINQLINKKVIKSYGAWTATLKYFTVNGDPITNRNIRKIEPMESTTKKRIDQVFLKTTTTE